MEEQKYFDKLKNKMDNYVHLVYRITKNFPREEIYGVTSQLRRSALSVILNFIEGYARMREKVQLNFFEISYGSLQESKYLLEFAHKEEYINDADFVETSKAADEIGAMLWTIKTQSIKVN
jgi:four helix bundle protein